MTGLLFIYLFLILGLELRALLRQALGHLNQVPLRGHLTG
jgi:hypothetical protein